MINFFECCSMKNHAFAQISLANRLYRSVLMGLQNRGTRIVVGVLFLSLLALTLHMVPMSWRKEAFGWEHWLGVLLSSAAISLCVYWLIQRRSVVTLPIEALPGATVRVDAAGRIRDINLAAGMALPTLAVGNLLAQVLDEEGVSHFNKLLAGKDRPPRGFNEFEARITGRRFRFLVGAALGDNADRYVKLTDITEFRSMSKRVLESEQRYRSLFSEHPDAVFSLGTDGRFVELNRRTSLLTGYRYDHIIGHQWEDFLHQDDVQLARTHFETVLQGNPCFYDCRVLDSDGEESVVHVTNIPMIVSGQIVGVFGVARDMTARHRLEARQTLLLASMAKIHEVIIITETSPLDEPGPRIVFVNDGVERLTGYRVDELMGRSPRIFHGPDTDPAACRRLAQALHARRPVKEVLLNYRKDGTPFWNELEIVHIAASGIDGREYFAAVQRDVTERKRQEQELQQSQEELRRLNSAQAGIREEERRRISRDLHDGLGQMLTAMKLELSLATNEMPARYGERMKEIVDFVDEIIDQVRETAANLRPGILDDLGFEAAAEWYLERHSSRYALDIRWLPDAANMARASGQTGTALFRILQECITNISRHATASRTVVRFEEKDDLAVLEVSDDGKGFDTLKRWPGLGLLGMRERVAMLGGDFSVDSVMGRGTRVRVSLPLEQNKND